MIAWLTGIGLSLLGWRLPRIVARTGAQERLALLLDLAIPALIFLIVVGLSGRPVFAGIVVLSLGAGYAYADRAKRRTLDEPIVFTDVYQALDVSRHPQLALPFPNKLAILVGVAGVVGVYIGLFALERRAFRAAPELGVVVIAVAWLVGRALVTDGSLRQRVAERLAKLGGTGDPYQDAVRLGPIGMHLVHGLVAAFERPARRVAAPELPRPRIDADGGPVVVVQSESFFDARRLHPSIDRQLLPNFDRACSEGVQHGRLTVPSWGANTVRTEFSVLTGIAPAAIGFDHFNPYRRFADEPLPTLASRLRDQGYRTIALHPFDRRFYRRDRVYPNFGFDEFIGEEAFGSDAERIDGYISDAEVTQKALEILRHEGPRTFLFIVTMENHGPWPGPCEEGLPFTSGLALPENDRCVLGRYLVSVRNADRMLGRLIDGMSDLSSDATLAFYGDHLPGFRSTFTQLGLTDRRSDYLLWRSGTDKAECRDVSSEELAVRILEAARSETGRGATSTISHGAASPTASRSFPASA